jgi:hypothetical protein
LTNMLACRHDTVIIEFHGSPPNFCYAAQSVMQHLRYFGSIADSRSNIDGDIYASVDDTITIIQDFVK